jgi:pimeloyl-ACP methyl ester carboxylesterase
MPMADNTPYTSEVPLGWRGHEGGAMALAVRRFGRPPPQVILLHGLASNARIWDGVARQLVRGGVSAAAVDQRGHGLSAGLEPVADFETLVADVDSVIAHHGSNRPVVVGHSWGATVALHHAVSGREPTSGLVLVDGGFLDYRAVPGLSETEAKARLAPLEWSLPLAHLLEAPWLDQRIDRSIPWIHDFLLGMVFLDDDGLAHPRLAAKGHRAISEQLVEDNPVPLLEKVAVPFRVCLATKEDLGIPKGPGFLEARSSVPRGSYCVHEDAPHDLPLFEPERLGREIVETLQLGDHVTPEGRHRVAGWPRSADHDVSSAGQSDGAHRICTT